MRLLLVSALCLLCCASHGFAIRASSGQPDQRGPVRERTACDDADPNATQDLFAIGSGTVSMTLSNHGEFGNPDGIPGFHGFEYPLLSGNDFLFSAGIWVGAWVDGTARVTTATDGDNGTNEFWPVHIGTVPTINEEHEDFDWHFSSRSISEFNGVAYVRGEIGIDDDGDWTLADDLNGNGVPDGNWDGGSGWIGSDDDHDGVADEEIADGQDNDQDGRMDEDTDIASDANHDGNCRHDPEGHVDEDPAGDIAYDYQDNDHDGFVDAADPDFDGDLVPGSLDDDGDGQDDEDAAAFADIEALAVFQDSISMQYVRSPSGLHVPLNIDIVQRVQSWPGYYAAYVLLVEYAVHNRGAVPLEHVYLATFADPDLLAFGESGDAGSMDDYNYFDAERAMAVQGDDPNDWDGDGPGVFAMKLVRAPSPISTLRFTFANFERLSGGDPEFDADKYAMMTSGNISPESGQLGDWRMLFSFGDETADGFLITPGGEIRFAVAFIGAPDIPFLNEIADSFQVAYLTGDFPQSPLPPESFRKTGTSSGQVSLAWSPPDDASVFEYSLYGRDDAGRGLRVHFWETQDTVVTVPGLANGEDWVFELLSLSEQGNPSIPVQLLVRVAAPDPLHGLTAVYQDDAVVLNWAAGPEPDIQDYWLERSDEWTGDVISLPTPNTHYTDGMVMLAHRYTYRVAARNTLGITGIWSDEVSVTPWAPQHRLLLLDEYMDTSPSLGGAPRDSIRAMYLSMLAELGIDYQYGTAASHGNLDSIARYDRIMYVNENRSSANLNGREGAFRQYMQNGGKLLRIGRRMTASGIGLNRGVYRDSPEGLEPLTFDSLYVSVWTASRPGMQFVGAAADAPGFPDVSVNPTRLDSLHFGSNSYEYLPEVDVFWPNDGSHPLYRTAVLPTDSSGYANQPCAVYTARAIAVAFPLYFLEYESARQLLGACLTALDTITSAVEPPSVRNPVVRQFRLLPNFPNPFNPSTTLRFELSTAATVRLEIFDVLGRLTATLIDGQIPAGVHQSIWNAGPAASGLYFARMTAGTQVSTQKLVLLK